MYRKTAAVWNLRFILSAMCSTTWRSSWVQPCLLRKPYWKSGRRLLLAVNSSSHLRMIILVTLLREWRGLIGWRVKGSCEGIPDFGMHMTFASFHNSGNYWILITLMILHRYEIRLFERISWTLLPMFSVPGLFLPFSKLMTEATLSGMARRIFEVGATKVETGVEMRRCCWSRSWGMGSRNNVQSAKISAFSGLVVLSVHSDRRKGVWNLFFRSDYMTF